MFIDTGTLIAISLALVGQMILLIALFRHAYKWEQEYRRVVRLLKMERAARQ